MEAGRGDESDGEIAGKARAVDEAGFEKGKTANNAHEEAVMRPSPNPIPPFNHTELFYL